MSGPQLGRLALLVALATALAGCARRVPQVEHPRWPAAPAAAVVQYVGGFPDERAARSDATAWERFVAFLSGPLTPEDAAGSPSILVRPFGLAASGDTLYVADPDAQRVLAVRWSDGTYQEVKCRFPWVTPMAVATAAGSVVYVADTGIPDVVQVNRADGACKQLRLAVLRPTGLAVAGGRLYVVDALGQAVVSVDLSTGSEATRFGAHGDGPGELSYPTSIAARDDGTLLVVDTLNARVVTFDSLGNFLGSFGKSGTEVGDFARPKAVAVNAKGELFVSDAQYGVVLLFGPDQAWRLAIDASGREPKALSLPAGLAVSGDLLFVADAYHHRVEVYRMLEVPP